MSMPRRGDGAIGAAMELECAFPAVCALVLIDDRYPRRCTGAARQRGSSRGTEPRPAGTARLHGGGECARRAHRDRRVLRARTWHALVRPSLGWARAACLALDRCAV